MSGQEKQINHYYLHADLDAFFASVEQLDHPEYRGKPVIVGGKPQDKRSVVSTASYEARVFGVHSAMPTAKAYQLCPQGIFVHGRMKRYSELSYQIMQIFSDFSPDVQQMSIDEAFIDLTGTEKLFGPPEETARRIKERVKAQTGLTVSIGLAPTKYLAKLASDMKKPDGFYMIQKGSEEEFMLNLPLKKVWGIGDKTYEALRSAGLKTTRDIHEKTLEALTFMYGQNTGNFLYKVVRGIEAVSFEGKAKSHSISNETTFPFDLTDLYTAETAMLELCHSVIFRLLKENGFSRTLQVKIRYEDFSTVSIQQTYPQSILTLDSLYTAAKDLFNKKYERGRGIRLLGIALENIEKTERAYQPGLFDDDNEKKQNVEKAILNLEKKHPEIKIHKARMLEKLGNKTKALILFAGLSLISLAFGKASYLFAQEEKSQETNYEITGSWSGKMKGSIDSTFGMGNKFGISAEPPVFDQEVDLSALVNITPNFYFQLEFLDKFHNNTYTLGYKGQGYLNEFKFSNRMITFPSEYSSTLNGYGISGGKNEAPGIMFHFDDYENQKWKGDILLRYDMTEQKTALFYGKNSVTDSSSELYSFVHSKAFVIPSDVIFNIRDVYIQSENGQYKSSDGISFYRLSSGDYAIDSQKSLLVLSDSINNLIKADTIPYILISFDNDQSWQTLLQDTGSYSDSASFAGQLQTLFNSQNSDISLEEYFALDQASVIKKINNTTAYVIQSNQPFSPYLCANIYKTDPNQSSEYLIKDRDSQITQASYSVRDLNNFYFSQTDYFDEKEAYVKVQNLNYPQAANDYLTPASRFPFADKYPMLYLKQKEKLSLVVTQRTTSPVKYFDIGKKASAGSVKVYKNGVLLAGALYDPNTGFVSLNEEVSELDKIYIVYEEESSDSSKGFVTTGTGFVYNILPSLVFDTSFTGKYQATDSLENLSKNSFSTVTNGITYKGKYLSAYDALSTSIESQKNQANSFVTKNSAGMKVQNSDGFLQADSQQEITLDTDKRKKASDSIKSNVKASYNLYGINAQADLSLSYLDLLTAGHSLTSKETLFNFLDFGEIYRFSKDEVDKKDYLSFAVNKDKDKVFNFSLEAQSSAKESQVSFSQNYLAQTESGLKFNNNSQSGLLIFSSSQQQDLKNNPATKANSNYFTSWYDISNNQISSGRNNSVRSTSFFAQYKSSYKALSLSPEISLELSGKNQNSEQKEFLTSDIFKFDLPFSTGNNAFNLNFVQKASIQRQNQNNKNYQDDIKTIFNQQQAFDFFYTALPFYSLFDKTYKSRIQKCPVPSSASLQYNFSWKRRLFNDIKDLYIPLSATAGLSRDLVNNTQNVKDLYQLKANISSSFINLFGSNSSLHYFDWYRQEEYTGFVNAIVKFSPDKDFSTGYQISSGEMLTFFIKDTDTLNINTDFYFDNYKNWKFKSSAAWSRSTNQSFLLALTHLCWAKSKELNLSPKVSDSISISLSTQNKSHKEIYSYLRSSEISFLTHFNLTSAAGLSFGYEEGKTFRLGLNYELGLKISF